MKNLFFLELPAEIGNIRVVPANVYAKQKVKVPSISNLVIPCRSVQGCDSLNGKGLL